MSESSEKVFGIKALPIFPLPLVLLPNEILPLHIFEPRYRQMLKDVEAKGNVFGVSLFEPAENFVEKPAIGTIGCAAEVRQVETLPDGRSNILTVGAGRYRLLDYVDAGKSYLVGDVEFFDDDAEDENLLNPLSDEVFALFRRIAEAAFKLGGERGRFPEIERAEPQAFSFLVTAAFNLENNLKYQMLEMRSTVERLERLREILLKTVDKMEETAEIHKISKTNGHTKKKLDF